MALRLCSWHRHQAPPHSHVLTILQVQLDRGSQEFSQSLPFLSTTPPPVTLEAWLYAPDQALWWLVLWGRGRSLENGQC